MSGLSLITITKIQSHLWFYLTMEAFKDIIKFKILFVVQLHVVVK